ncbi:metaxin-3-like [Sinocyclocheilus grahami]|uniref:metaxin-3-like n=1 Tax=Sinocyclocheilus grahami TaxID=75366 RepID=UPI0007AC82E6|nr:PREDICTED: metaxin-3-like [Sinocyclocheilus grahami]
MLEDRLLLLLLLLLHTNMAEPMELLCWGGDWDLPSVHTDSLIVLAYAKFSGATLAVKSIDWTWRTITASVPQLHYEGSTVTEPTQILNFLRKQVEIHICLAMPSFFMDDNLRSSPQHRPHRHDTKPTASEKNSTLA